MDRQLIDAMFGPHKLYIDLWIKIEESNVTGMDGRYRQLQTYKIRFRFCKIVAHSLYNFQLFFENQYRKLNHEHTQSMHKIQFFTLCFLSITSYSFRASNTYILLPLLTIQSLLAGVLEAARSLQSIVLAWIISHKRDSRDYSACKRHENRRKCKGQSVLFTGYSWIFEYNVNHLYFVLCWSVSNFI